MNAWLEPFQYGFMREAMLAGCFVGAVCAVLSCFLVLKGWSLMGDAVSHGVLPGLVIAYVIGLPLALGAFVSGLFCAVATGYIKANSRVKEDTVMGVVFTGLFALGLVIFTKVKTDIHIDHVLFGNILGVTRGQLWQTGLMGGAALLLLLLFRRDLLLFCFDVAHARSLGLNTKLLYYLLLSLLAVTIVVSLQAVGIILVVSMLVTPGCVAYLLTDRFDRMLLIASASAVSSALLGVWASFLINGSSGACIVLVQSAQFLAAMVAAPKHGMMAHRLARLKTLRVRG